MRLKDEPTRLVMWNAPRLRWPLAVLLVTAGGCALLVTAGQVSGARPYTLGVRVVAGGVGTLALALGAWLCWRAPLSALVVDRVGRTVTLTRRLGRQHETPLSHPYPLSRPRLGSGGTTAHVFRRRGDRRRRDPHPL